MAENNSGNNNAQTPPEQNAQVEPPAAEETAQNGQNGQNGQNAQNGQNGQNAQNGQNGQNAQNGQNGQNEFENVGVEEEAPEEVVEEAPEEVVEEAPVEEAPPAKRQQSLKQKQTMSEQAEERQKLKNAGVAKPSVAMVATLTKLRTKEDSSYDTAFANAVAGRPLNSYRQKTEKKPRARKGETVINTTARNGRNNAGRNNASRNTASNATSFMAPPSQAANVRANSEAAAATIKSIEQMGASAMGTIRAMVDATKNLARELAKTGNSSGLERVSSSLVNSNSNISKLFNSGTNTSKKARKPRGPRKSKKNTAVNVSAMPPLPVIPEGEGENGTVENL